MSTNARKFVNPPTFSPSPYGLLSAVDIRPDDDPHWRAGVTWYDICGGSMTYVDTCLTSAPAITGTGQQPNKSATTARTLYGATPFTVVVEIDCSPVDFYDNAEQTMEAALARYESYELERTFWTGTAFAKNGVGGVGSGVFPHLAANATVKDTNSGSLTQATLQMQAVQVTGTGVNIVQAMGLLEGALAGCLNGAGVIHVPQSVSPVMAGLGLLKQTGNRILSPNGNIISIGAGYAGTGPDGSTPALGQGWLYATSQIFAYKGRPYMFPKDGSIDRATNTLKVIIERTWLFGYSCCLFAVKVNDANIIATSTTTP